MTKGSRWSGPITHRRSNRQSPTCRWHLVLLQFRKKQRSPEMGIYTVLISEADRFRQWKRQVVILNSFNWRVQKVSKGSLEKSLTMFYRERDSTRWQRTSVRLLTALAPQGSDASSLLKHLHSHAHKDRQTHRCTHACAHTYAHPTINKNKPLKTYFSLCALLFCQVPWSKVIDSCELLYGCWELNQSRQEKQPVLLTTEPFLQPHKSFLFF